MTGTVLFWVGKYHAIFTLSARDEDNYKENTGSDLYGDLIEFLQLQFPGKSIRFRVDDGDPEINFEDIDYGEIVNAVRGFERDALPKRFPKLIRLIQDHLRDPIINADAWISLTVKYGEEEARLFLNQHEHLLRLGW